MVVFAGGVTVSATDVDVAPDSEAFEPVLTSDIALAGRDELRMFESRRL
jgi:hypothetical protein